MSFSRRSNWTSEPLAGRILLIDSIGELASLYSLADVVFVGGSLVPRGGHSILEPAQHEVAILVGPHNENFRDIVELFRAQDAVRVVNAAALAQAISGLFDNTGDRIALGRRAFETLQSRRGATQFTLDQLRSLIQSPGEARSA